MPLALANRTPAVWHLMAAGAGVPPAVSQLTHQVVSAMNRPKRNVLAVGLAAVVLMAGGPGVWRGSESSAAPVPKAAPDDGLIWLLDRTAGELVAYSPALTERKRVKLPADERFFGLTPDGQHVLHADKRDGGTYHLRPLDGGGTPVDLGLDASATDVGPRWNPAGTQFVRQRAFDPNRTPVAYRFDLFDLASKKAVRLDHLDGHWLLGWADGGHLVSRVKEGDGYDSVCRTSLAGERTALVAGDQLAAQHLAVAGDGAAFVGGRRSAVPGGKKRHAVWAVDLKSGDLNELFRDDDQQQTTPTCSPDGKRVAFTWECRQDRTGLDQFRLSVADRDGTHRTTVTLLDAAKGDDTGRLSLLGWYPARPDARRIKAQVPKAEPSEGRILFWVDDKPLLLKANGTELESPDPIPKVTALVPWGNAQMSPDGKRVAFARGRLDERCTLHVLDLDGKKETKEYPAVHLNRFHWVGPDKVYVRGTETGADGGEKGKWGDWVYDLATGKRAPLKVPKDFTVRSVSPDGRAAVVDEWKRTATAHHQHAHMWTVGEDKPTPLLELNQGFRNLRPQFTPDGTRLLCQVTHFGSYTPDGNGDFNTADFKFNNLLVIDLATKKQTVAKEWGEKPEWRVRGYAWSPDATKIAYVETKPLPEHPGGPTAKTSFRLLVADADGKNEKEVYKAEGLWLTGFDWR